MLRRFLNEFLGQHRVTQGRIFRVSYRDLCYSVLPFSDKDTIGVLPSLTPEKVGLPGSELPRCVVLWRHDLNNGSASTLRSVLWNETETFH